MKKAFLSMTLMGALAATGSLVSAQQQQQPGQQAQQGQEMSADEVFARLDGDRDGKLSEAEFSRANASASAEEKKQMFADWDADGDSSISKAEFTAKYSPSGGQ
jgi:Ca2+-binding EF-hand superfamily protein